MFIVTILNIVLVIIIYYIIDLFSFLRFNSINKYIKTVLNKISYITSLNKSLNYINKIYPFNTSIINSINIFVLSLIFAIINFCLFFSKFKLLLSSFIIFLISLFIPLIILELTKIGIKYQIKKSFSLYVIGVLSYSTNSNDVIMAINNVKSLPPLDKYIYEFNSLVNNGFDIIKAFNFFIEEIKIIEISKFIELLKLCYINGSNLNRVVSQYYKYFKQSKEVNKVQNEKRNYYYIILGIILTINIFLVFFVILKNTEYREILLNTFLGKVLLNINMLVYLGIFLIVMKSLKKEE